MKAFVPLLLVLAALLSSTMGCGDSGGGAGTVHAGAGGIPSSGAGGSSGGSGQGPGGADAGDDASGGGGGGDGGSGGGDGGIGGQAALACDPQRIAIRGTLDGQAFARDYSIESRSVGDFDTRHDLNYLNKTGDLTLQWAQPIVVGQAASLLHFDLILPSTDMTEPRAVFCGASGETLRFEDRYVHQNVSLGRLICPGVPINGEVTGTPDALSGTIDGIALDAATQWILVEPGRARLNAVTADIRLALDDAGTQATSGNVVGGHIWTGWNYYCVGGGSFTRSDPSDDRSVSFTLRDISKVSECGALPVAGTFDICVSDRWQLERP